MHWRKKQKHTRNGYGGDTRPVRLHAQGWSAVVSRKHGMPIFIYRNLPAMPSGNAHKASLGCRTGSPRRNGECKTGRPCIYHLSLRKLWHLKRTARTKSLPVLQICGQMNEIMDQKSQSPICWVPWPAGDLFAVTLAEDDLSQEHCQGCCKSVHGQMVQQGRRGRIPFYFCFTGQQYFAISFFASLLFAIAGFICHTGHMTAKSFQMSSVWDRNIATLTCRQVWEEHRNEGEYLFFYTR